MGQGGHDVLHGLAVVLPAVAGDQKDLFPAIGQAVELLGVENVIRTHGGFQRVDHGVAGDEHALGHRLPAEVLPVVLRGAEVQVRNLGHQLPVHFLGVRRILVVGPEPRLHVAHRHLVVEGRQGPGEGGGGVPVDQDHIRLQCVDGLIHAGEALAGDGAEGLPGGHDVQVPVRLQAKDLQHAVQHFPMLGGDAADRLYLLPRGQLLHQGGHLDGLRPGAEHAHNAQLFHVSPPLSPPYPRRGPPPGVPACDGRGDSGRYGPRCRPCPPGRSRTKPPSHIRW